MAYQIELSKQAEKFIGSLSKKNAILVTSKIATLADDPYNTSTIKLKGEDNVYRIRAGNYRILYEVINEILTVKVVQIGDRKDIYE